MSILIALWHTIVDTVLSTVGWTGVLLISVAVVMTEVYLVYVYYHILEQRRMTE